MIRAIYDANGIDSVEIDRTTTIVDGRVVSWAWYDDLYHVRVITHLSPEIGRLSALQMLWLPMNRLVTLPDEIGDLSALEDLRLFENTLEELPDALGRLTSLYRLDLRDNRLTGLPQAIIGLSPGPGGLLVCRNRLVDPGSEVASWLDAHAEPSWRTCQDTGQ